jgi:Flp pilus assembly pilin Flp
MFSRQKQFLADESGTASIEFIIVLALMVVAMFAVGKVLGPAIDRYANHLTAVSQRAENALSNLNAANITNSTGP